LLIHINFLCSSANAKKWEIELTTLKNNNMRLTSALQESTANVEEWKRQLHSYKEENQRMKTKYIELEAAKGMWCHDDVNFPIIIFRIQSDQLLGQITNWLRQMPTT
jgi:hypothetical protein